MAVADHELHHEVEAVAAPPTLVDGDDIWVGKAGEGHRLGLKPSRELRIIAEVRGQHLDGDGPVKRFLAGLEDEAHSPPTDLPLHLITGNLQIS